MGEANQAQDSITSEVESLRGATRREVVLALRNAQLVELNLPLRSQDQANTPTIEV
jgi:hypothetical protein